MVYHGLLLSLRFSRWITLQQVLITNSRSCKCPESLLTWRLCRGSTRVLKQLSFYSWCAVRTFRFSSMNRLFTLSKGSFLELKQLLLKARLSFFFSCWNRNCFLINLNLEMLLINYGYLSFLVFLWKSVLRFRGNVWKRRAVQGWWCWSWRYWKAFAVSNAHFGWRLSAFWRLLFGLVRLRVSSLVLRGHPPQRLL